MKSLLLTGLLVFLFILPLSAAQDTTEYDYGRVTVCENITESYRVCNMQLFSGVRFVPEDGRWIEVEKARRLDNKGVFTVKTMSDGVHGLEVVRFNYSCITVKPYSASLTGFKYNKPTPVKIDGSVVGMVKIPGVLSPLHDIEYCFGDSVLSHDYSFGEESTTIQLQDADTENLEDAVTYNGGPQASVLSSKWFVKFNISSIPDSSSISDSQLCVYVSSRGVGWDNDINFLNINSQNWAETDSAATLSGLSVSTRLLDSSFGESSGAWSCSDVTDIVNVDHTINDNCSIRIEDPDYNNSGSISDPAGDHSHTLGDKGVIGCVNCYIEGYLKEYTSDASLRVYLNITYSEGTPPSEDKSDCQTEEAGRLYIPPGCRYYTNVKEEMIHA